MDPSFQDYPSSDNEGLKTPRKRRAEESTANDRKRLRRTSLFKPDAALPRANHTTHRRRRSLPEDPRDCLLSATPANLLLSPKHSAPLLRATPRTNRLMHYEHLTQPCKENGQHAFLNSLTKDHGFWQDYSSHLPPLGGSPRVHQMSSLRHFESTPIKILDAPRVYDDFYLNTLTWSHNNLIAIGLGTSIHLYDVTSRRIAESFPSLGGDVLSAQWAGKDGPSNTLAIALDDDIVRIYDTSKAVKKSVLQGPRNSISTGEMSWHGDMLAVGFGKGLVKIYDTRLSTAKACIATMHGHGSHRVSGVKWNADGHLLATGGNDNVAKVWDIRGLGIKSGRQLDKNESHQSLWTWSHAGCVKALAWCPWNPYILATGGGSGDGKICLRTTATGETQATIPLIGQITSIHFSTQCKEFVCTTGYPAYHSLRPSRPILPISSPGIQHPARLAGSPLTTPARPSPSASPATRDNLVRRYRTNDYAIQPSTSFSLPEDPFSSLHDVQAEFSRATTQSRSLTYITRTPNRKTTVESPAPKIAPFSLPPSPNSIVTYAYPSLERLVAVPYAHSSRILMSAMGPDGTTIATSGGDETLRFWKTWGDRPKKEGLPRSLDSDEVILR